MNPLLQTDVYKMGHMEQYAPGVNKVYSYLTARSSKNFPQVVFFGLQYYLMRYLKQPLTREMGLEFLDTAKCILGRVSPDVHTKIMALCDLGYFPLEIKAVPEGTKLPVRNVLMTITNTLPQFAWVVGFVESLLLKVWYPCTVATHSNKYREFIQEMYNKNSPQNETVDFAVHDFGYRGDSSEEGAGISGMAHLINFLGSDTVPAHWYAKTYYWAQEPIMLSVPASEHSVMCSFGRQDELAAFEHMLDTYPSGIVSIVSDTFNVYRVLTEFVDKLKPRILARDGKVVFRPDSGNPEYIICGNPDADPGSLEWKGAIRILDEQFGSTRPPWKNKVLNPKVGLIYGDGMYFERYKRTIERLDNMGYAASNLVIGVGGILRNHSRDTLGFAIKATYVEVNGVPREIEKDPITDPGKKSAKGLMYLKSWPYETVDQCTPEQERGGMLRTVFRDGQITSFTTFKKIRELLR